MLVASRTVLVFIPLVDLGFGYGRSGGEGGEGG